jgi:hypothetical protein|tara:strand:+ start:593 stop:1588 length:996 start_codon:yes stop_codon:yes gene_type:complete
MTTLIGPEKLLEIISEPNLADAGPGDVSAIALDLRDQCLNEQEVSRVKQWLTHQPVVIVGLVNENRQLIDALDLAVDSNAEVETSLNAIHRNPMASAVLVQVTRATASLPIATALSVESLGYATLQSGEEFRLWLAEYRKTKKSNKAIQVSNPVVIERKGSALHLQLNSLENRNALSTAMRDGLTEAFKLVAVDASIQRVIVSGNGPCFSAGGDLTEFGSAKDLTMAHHIRQLRMPAQYLAPHAARYSFQLHGACIGAGIELPAFAHHLTAKPDSFFQLPEVGMGLIPGAGGCVSIPRRIGRHRTNYLAITGERLSAEKALSWGLIDEIVD